MDTLKPKITIIGCGAVGVKFAYALVIEGLARQLVIIDKDRKKLEGEIMDLSHCQAFTSPIELIAGDYPDTVDSDIVVITAGVKQKPNQSRLDLVNANVEIFKEIIPNLIKYTASSIFLIVTNPVDVLSYVAYKLSGKPANKVIGSGTVLDSARFRFLLAKHCKIDARNVHAYILGEHGDTEVPIWSKAMMGGINIKEYCPVCKDKNNCQDTELEKIFIEVRDSAYKIIERKNETSYGIGLALLRIVTAIIKDENAILPVSVLVDGYLDIKDVYMGLPAIVNKYGVKDIIFPKLEKEEKEKLKKSAQVIKEVIDKLKI
ncbi:MAG: L-lactate dehydrogenase [Candidatus Omnitrophica bacterium]|nr:L-lactate dehydrogenase [Candidatus Omnitrophota bacterium]MCM8831305.1 L-lactate dehydrogenase [Candidatus Omnitrophota bacterium]